MPLAVVLHSNIYNEDGEKCLRGESFEASQDFVDMVLKGDEEAGRQARISVVTPKRGRPRKESSHEDS